MTVLSLRTDKPEAEVGLYEGDNKLAYVSWGAHRHLAESLLTKIEQLLNKHQKQWQDINGIVVYKGPGSFTGLRIGLTVANTLAYAISIPLAGSTGDDWLRQGFKSLSHGLNDTQVLPEYGSPVRITLPKK